ncbi:MAG: hypothetical protein RR547_10690, partial [Raoultibacter sp.]
MKASPSYRLKHEGSSSAQKTRAARAEKKLSKLDRNAIDKKYSKKSLALATLAAQMSFDASSDEQEQSPGDALGAVTTLRTPGHDQRVAKHAARSSRVSRVARTQQKNEAQIAVEKHVEKVASKQAKERSVESARKTAARSR